MKYLAGKRDHMKKQHTNIRTYKRASVLATPRRSLESIIWEGDVSAFLDALPRRLKFDLVVTSPPYNVGKEYERRMSAEAYLAWQRDVILKLSSHVKKSGSVCWQVGNFVDNGKILPLDILIAPIFFDLGFQLRNRIVWHFGHGLHSKKRFSGRYEVILWFTRSDEYVFNLDSVRIPQKYPGKRHYNGHRIGEFSSNPMGKNPSDVWDIPNVKSNHIEKTIHPCQFPVGLVERLVLSLTGPRALVCDPFAGVGTTGVAAVTHGRRYWGCEIDARYNKVATTRINSAMTGAYKYRQHDKPVYDHSKSSLSVVPGHFSYAEFL